MPIEASLSLFEWNWRFRSQVWCSLSSVGSRQAGPGSVTSASGVHLLLHACYAVTGFTAHLLTYIDDVLFASKTLCTALRYQEYFLRTFKIQDKGSVHDFLGLTILWRGERTLYLDQRRYVQDVGCGLGDRNKASNPLPTNIYILFLERI